MQQIEYYVVKCYGRAIIRQKTEERGDGNRRGRGKEEQKEKKERKRWGKEKREFREGRILCMI